MRGFLGTVLPVATGRAPSGYYLSNHAEKRLDKRRTSPKVKCKARPNHEGAGPLHVLLRDGSRSPRYRSAGAHLHLPHARPREGRPPGGDRRSAIDRRRVPSLDHLRHGAPDNHDHHPYQNGLGLCRCSPVTPSLRRHIYDLALEPWCRSPGICHVG